MSGKIIKRAIIALLIAACLITIMLGAVGVFARGAGLKKGDISFSGGGDVIISNFESEGADWVLKAVRAVRKPSGKILFEKPVLNVRQRVISGEDKGGKPRDLAVCADTGASDGEKAPVITLEGRVVVESSAPDAKTVLRGQHLVWDERTEMVNIKGPVNFSSSQGNQSYEGSGEDAEADVRARRIAVARNARIILPPGANLIGGSQEKSGAETPTIVTSDGRFLADDFAKTVKLSGGVKIVHGEDSLIADTVTGALGSSAAQELEAVGAVRLRSGELVGEAEKFNRSPSGRILLWGHPARLLRGENVFSCDRIELLPETNTIACRDPGGLNVIVGEGENADHAVINWQGQMEYVHDKGRAFFRDGVRVLKTGQEITCGRMNLKLDPDKGELNALTAEENVIARTEQGTAYAKTLTWDARGDLFTFDGEPARFEEGDRTMSASRIRIGNAGKTVACDGAGNLQVRAEGDAAPSKVSWAEHMNYDEERNGAAFKGKVVYDDGARKLRSESLQVMFDADRKVRELNCPNAGSFSEAAAGEQLARDVAWKESMHFDQALNQAIFLGEVKYTEGVREMLASEVTIDFDAAGGVKSAKGRGHVSLIEGETKVYAEKFAYNVKDGAGEILGEGEVPARIWHRGNWQCGMRIVFSDNFTEILITDPVRVEGSFQKQ